MIILHLLSKRKKLVVSIPVILLLTFSFLGCKVSFGAPIIGARPDNHASPAVTQATTGTSNIGQPTTRAVDIDGLHIQSDPGMLIPAPPYLNCGRTIIFTTSQLSYDTGELQQMATYLKHVAIPAYRNDPVPLLPPTLMWAPGTKAAPALNAGGGCNIGWQITNTGDTIVQIPMVSLILTRQPQKNFYHYRTLDSCSLAPTICSPWGSGGASCAHFEASIAFGATAHTKQSGAVFSARLKGIPRVEPFDCGELTLAPGHAITLYVSVYLPPDNFLYHAIPELTIATANGGAHTLQLPQFGGVLTNASNQSFSCYGLEGNTFKAEGSDFHWMDEASGKMESGPRCAEGSNPLTSDPRTF